MAQYIDKDAVAEIKNLYEDIDKCIGDLVLARSKHDQRGISDAHWKMETLMVNTQQVLSYILQYLEVKEIQEEPVNEELEEASKYYALNNTPWDDCVNEIQESFKAGVKWQKEKEEPINEDLGLYINELSKQFPEVSFAKLSRIGVRVAKWQKSHLWKPADGDDMPEIDREVIALLDNGKVVYAHRPPEYWDGKNIATGKVTRYYPKTYDNGGWNIPNVKWWLDCLMPKEIEL